MRPSGDRHFHHYVAFRRRPAPYEITIQSTEKLRPCFSCAGGNSLACPWLRTQGTRRRV